ncbi:lipopolysaccharide biosynthesis protein [Methylococcus geothermalis]|uniref:Oligosaccharide flippase family protein n=1 Tax=Methylococcus geothermalis TaxID=2681310 RepID=A0A858Q8Q3_9GAMM|nr:polysaccharide biosynthesis C-terminal domain-containing protein [Methylococcus geothermalis]QJD30203.1 oligosaccharide flippase family protein [Methylococcus geothermalis]
MNPLKKLAGQTAIYGLSTIIGRLLNYFLVPLYTYQFANPGEFGVMTEFYAYTSFLNVVLTYGMETALFNFSAKSNDGVTVYSTALLSLVLSTALYLTAVLWQADSLADLLQHPDRADYVRWVAWIIALDALAAIPFAKLREQQKAKRFAVLKTTNILVNIAANVFFIGLCKGAYDSGTAGSLAWAGRLYDPEIGIGYVFIANLIASGLTLALLLPELAAVKLRFDVALWRRMLAYALPLLVAGLAGMVNETMDRILLKYLLPADVAMEQLGIYGACYKIAILMSLFIQAFRYAAEPFFFSHYRQKEAKELYALVMNWFVMACSLIFLGVMLNLGWIQYFVGARYRAGIDVVPILLMANLWLGIFFNFSLWYKLTEQTRFGTYLTVWGAVVTLALNIYWIPRLGYRGAAWATLACYGSMALLSYVLGQRFYPVRYDLKRILGYPTLAVGIWRLTERLPPLPFWAEVTFNNSLLLLVLALAVVLERHRHGDPAPVR